MDVDNSGSVSSSQVEKKRGKHDPNVSTLLFHARTCGTPFLILVQRFTQAQGSVCFAFAVTMASPQLPRARIRRAYRTFNQ